MKKTALTITVISALLLSVVAGIQFINPASAQTFAAVTIKADGSIEPATAPIQRNGNLYTVTDDISGYLVLERNYTTLNGAGHHVRGVYGPLLVQVGYDWIVNGTTNMTVTNVVIDGEGIVFFSTQNTVLTDITLNNGTGIDVNGDGNLLANTTVNYGRGLSVNGKNNVVSGNHLNNCNYTFAENNPPPYGIGVGGSNNIVIGNYIIGTNGSAVNLGTSSDNTVFGNQIENNKIGIRTMAIYSQISAENNTVYNNNFVNNLKIYHDEMIMAVPASVTIWDYSTTGNYWSDYNGSDADGDGKGDMPYIIDANNQDNCPLMNPVDITDISTLPVQSPAPSPSATPNPSPTMTPSPTGTPIPTPTATSGPTPKPEPFPTTLVIGSAVAAIAVVGLGLLVYFKRRKREEI